MWLGIAVVDRARREAVLPPALLGSADRRASRPGPRRGSAPRAGATSTLVVVPVRLELRLQHLGECVSLSGIHDGVLWLGFGWLGVGGVGGRSGAAPLGMIVQTGVHRLVGLVAVAELPVQLVVFGEVGRVRQEFGIDPHLRIEVLDAGDSEREGTPRMPPLRAFACCGSATRRIVRLSTSACIWHHMSDGAPPPMKLSPSIFA